MIISIKDHPNHEEIKILKFSSYSDHRGLFSRKYCKKELKDIYFDIKQINISKNFKKGTVRGLHYMKSPSKEKKIVICLSGEIFDVLVDIRKKSKTFKKIIKIHLSEDKLLGIYIPNGFAHGFQSLKKNTTLLYLHSDFYKKSLDVGISPLQKSLKIKWPLKISNISQKDINLPEIEKI